MRLKEIRVVLLYGKDLGQTFLLESDTGWGLISGAPMEAEVDTHAAWRLILEQTGLDVPITPHDYRRAHSVVHHGGDERLACVFGLIVPDDRCKKGAWFPTHQLPGLDVPAVRIIQAVLTHFFNQRQ